MPRIVTVRATAGGVILGTFQTSFSSSLVWLKNPLHYRTQVCSVLWIVPCTLHLHTYRFLALHILAGVSLYPHHKNSMLGIANTSRILDICLTHSAWRHINAYTKIGCMPSWHRGFHVEHCKNRSLFVQFSLLVFQGCSWGSSYRKKIQSE